MFIRSGIESPYGIPELSIGCWMAGMQEGYIRDRQI